MRVLLTTVIASVVAIAMGCSNNKQVATPLESTVAEVKEQPAALQPEKAEQVAVVPDNQESVDYSPIYFEFDSFKLGQGSRARLDAMASSLRGNDKLTVTIEGHCDERGTTEYNLSLGERRAQVIQGYLETVGVSAQQLKVVTYGKERPAVAGSDEPAWSQNRRGEFVPVEEKGPTAAR